MSDAYKTRVQLDWGKNRKATLVLALVAAAGVGLTVFGVTQDWGFLGLFWTGVLAVGGLAGLLGRALGGGFATAPCPNCHAPLSFVHIRTERTVRCDACQTWSTGTATMQRVSDDHVAREPVFDFVLPDEGIHWPHNDLGGPICTVCMAPATRRVTVTGSDAVGAAAAAVSPVSVRRIRTLEVPACAAHDDGVAMGVAGKEVTLLFRSLPYWKRIVSANNRTA